MREEGRKGEKGGREGEEERREGALTKPQTCLSIVCAMSYFTTF